MQAISLILIPCAAAALAQTPQIPTPPPPALTTQTTLVLVPALVRTKSGEPVFTLAAGDFKVTDDGVEQTPAVDADTGAEPLALVIAVETGGAGAAQLPKYRNLAPLIEAVVGSIRHRVAVVTFDTAPQLAQDFTSDFSLVEGALHSLKPSTGGPAILDTLAYSVELLHQQPLEYRRAVLLLSESLDHQSRTSLEQALEAVSDTNTAIYSVGFSSTKAAIKDESAKFSQPDTPGPAGGCMARDPDNPDQNRLAQAFECLSLLAPPLRAAKMAAILGQSAMRRNVPESVAQLTGGEYFKLGDAHSLERDLVAIGQHLPNRYVLSFHPQSPHPGFHTVGVKLRNYPGLTVTARTGYWADSETAADANP